MWRAGGSEPVGKSEGKAPAPNRGHGRGSTPVQLSHPISYTHGGMNHGRGQALFPARGPVHTLYLAGPFHSGDLGPAGSHSDLPGTITPWEVWPRCSLGLWGHHLRVSPTRVEVCSPKLNQKEKVFSPRPRGTLLSAEPL